MLPRAPELDEIGIMAVLSSPTWKMPTVRCLMLAVFTQIMYLRFSCVVMAVSVMLRRLVFALVTTWAPFTCWVRTVRFTAPPTPRVLARPRLLCPSRTRVLFILCDSCLVRQTGDGWLMQRVRLWLSLVSVLVLLWKC